MTTSRTTTALALILALGLTTCTAGSDGRDGARRDGAPDIEVPAVGGTFEIPSRVASIAPIEVEVLQKGTGLHARDGDTVAVHYTGTLLDGKQFDTSRGGVPFEFPLGQGAVIRGWDMVVSHMTVGDRWRVRIPAQLAYDKIGSPPVIPPSADLVFDMELVRVR